jgi:hypothetical protein
MAKSIWEISQYLQEAQEYELTDADLASCEFNFVSNARKYFKKAKELLEKMGKEQERELRGAFFLMRNQLLHRRIISYDDDLKLSEEIKTESKNVVPPKLDSLGKQVCELISKRDSVSEDIEKYNVAVTYCKLIDAKILECQRKINDIISKSLDNHICSH